MGDTLWLTANQAAEPDYELQLIASLYGALRTVGWDRQERILDYLYRRLRDEYRDDLADRDTGSQGETSARHLHVISRQYDDEVPV